METTTYHCMNPDENPFPYWIKWEEKKPEESQMDLVQQFKNNPEAFFPQFKAQKKNRIK